MVLSDIEQHINVKDSEEINEQNKDACVTVHIPQKENWCF